MKDTIKALSEQGVLIKTLFLSFSLLLLLGCSSSNSTTNNTPQRYGAITSIKEASGIGYCEKSDTLFVAADNGILYEITKEGEILQKKDLSSLKNHDFEGIAYDTTNDTLLVAIEGSDNVLVLTTDLIVQGKLNIERKDAQNRLILAKDKENGLEGIGVKEGEIYLSNQSFTTLPAQDPSVLIRIEPTSNESAKISEVIDHGYLNISGLTFYQGLLYMVTDSDNLLIAYDLLNQRTINSYKIKSFDNTLKGAAIEGVAFDRDGNIYFANDSGGKIYKFKFK